MLIKLLFSGRMKAPLRTFGCVCVVVPFMMQLATVRAEVPMPLPKPELPDMKSGFSMFDFTAALLDFSGPPVPVRKPEFIPRSLSVIEKLQQKAAEDLSEKPLSQSDAKIYNSVFEAQAAGDFKNADEMLKDLDDVRLLGHVLFQRYMHPKAYRSSFSELRSWLEYYNDHPGANRIYKLANARAAGSTAPLARPEKSRGIVRTDDPTMRQAKRYVSSRVRSDEDVRALNKVNRDVFVLIRKGQPSLALEKLEAPDVKSTLDTVEYDRLRAEIAAGYLYNGNAKKAYELAAQSVQRSGLHAPKAGWVAGLVAWRAKKYTQSAKFFEIVGRSPYASGWTMSAGAYWAWVSIKRN